MKIKYVNYNPGYIFQKHGNWIDLAVSRYYVLSRGEAEFLDLGIAMKLPKWYKAEVKPRSSTFKKFGIIQVNSVGEIDTNYSGPNDVWKMPVYCLRPMSRINQDMYATHIPENSRVAQFTVRLREDAPWYMKIKDLFTTYKFVEVKTLKDKNRGGFGSTG